MLDAMRPVSAERTLREKLALVTGALVADLLTAQEKTLEEAATLTGFSTAQLRADGLEFAMALVRAMGSELSALMDADTAESEAAQIARIAANAHGTAHVPGTMV
ncbi:hypothetical protein ASF52_09520 [Methylobacterium sp. Leaf112]|nr:hypothetical protein ASF52_09520 [Methylobacterium sp. Leaf112]